MGMSERGMATRWHQAPRQPAREKAMGRGWWNQEKAMGRGRCWNQEKAMGRGWRYQEKRWGEDGEIKKKRRRGVACV